MTSKLNYLIFALAGAAGISIRTVMLLFTVEETSGFIISEYALPATMLIVFLIAAAAVVFFFSLVSKPTLRKNSSADNIFFPLSCILTAIAIVYETYFSSLTAGSAVYQIFIHCLLSALAAFSLLLIAYCYFTKMTFPPILSVVPVLFWIMRLIIIFSSFSTISAISDTIIETAAMCLTLITFVIYAKLESGALEKKRYAISYATALLNGYVCLISSVPRIICEVASFEQAVHLHPVPSLTSLSAAFFSIMVSARLAKTQD